jgi:guanyl-specific ribonuclease Sa
MPNEPDTIVELRKALQECHNMCDYTLTAHNYKTPAERIEMIRGVIEQTMRSKPEKWTLTKDKLPPENVVVITKIDEGGFLPRQEQPLIRFGKLWFHVNKESYVYYTPTHWRHRDQ